MSATQRQVNANLEHLPKGDMNQSLLQMAYNAARLQSLGAKTAGAVAPRGA